MKPLVKTPSSPKIKLKENPIPETATVVDRLILISLWGIFLAYTAVILLEPWYLPNDWCPYEGMIKTYPNPDSKATNVCYYHRSPYLLGLSPLETDFGRRVLASLIFGSCIGWERKAVDRPAGIRTMSLVCLGACIFTMCGQFAFRSSTQDWDAARVSAPLPSGVGFLGSALIWKESMGTKGTVEERHSVHGLTTAASVWLSASVGIGAGGGLYLYCTWAVVLVCFILRLGPRMALIPNEDSSYGGGDTDDWDTGASEDANVKTEGGGDDDDGDTDEDEPVPLSRQEQLSLLREQAAAGRGDQLSMLQDQAAVAVSTAVEPSLVPPRSITSVPKCATSTKSSRRSQLKRNGPAVSFHS